MVESQGSINAGLGQVDILKGQVIILLARPDKKPYDVNKNN